MERSLHRGAFLFSQRIMYDKELFDHLAQFVTSERLELFDAIAPKRTRHVCAVLEDVYQAHNASAVLRTCDLVGVQDVHVIEDRNRYTVNPDVALGSSKWVDIHRYNTEERNTPSCVAALRNKGYRIVVTSPHVDAHTPENIPLDVPLAICFGTELTGASDALIDLADDHLRIPMYGFTESYNISVSAAIVLYTITQRLRTIGGDHFIHGNALLELKLKWLRRSLKSAAEIEARFRKERGEA